MPQIHEGSQERRQALRTISGFDTEPVRHRTPDLQTPASISAGSKPEQAKSVHLSAGERIKNLFRKTSTEPQIPQEPHKTIKTPILDFQVEKLFREAAEEDSKGEHNAARFIYTNAATRARSLYEQPVEGLGPEEILIRAAYGERALMGFISAGEMADAFVLASKLLKEKDEVFSQDAKERVRKRLEMENVEIL